MKTTEIHIGHPAFGIHYRSRRYTLVDAISALGRLVAAVGAIYAASRIAQAAQAAAQESDEGSAWDAGVDEDPKDIASAPENLPEDLLGAPPPEPPDLDTFVRAWVAERGHPELAPYLAVQLATKDPAEWAATAMVLWPRMTDEHEFARYFADGNNRPELAGRIAKAISSYTYPDWGHVAWGVLGAIPPRPATPPDAAGAVT